MAVRGRAGASPATNVTLRFLIMNAYNVRDDQISVGRPGLPLKGMMSSRRTRVIVLPCQAEPDASGTISG